MDISDAAPFLTDHQKAVIITMSEGRSEGTPEGVSVGEVPHASNVIYSYDGVTFRISVTDGRVKTGNLRRRPLAVLHVSSSDFWRWVAVECDVDLSPISMQPGDATGRELLALYESASEPHPHPEEFLQAMVDDRRLVLRLTPTRVYGQLG